MQTSAAVSADLTQAEVLVRRAPMGFLWNQLYQLWFFGASFLLTEVVTRGLSPRDYGVYATALTTFTTVSYLAAFGLEEAATIWVPRALTEDGRAQASIVIRRLLGVRLLFLLSVCAAMLFLFPMLTGWLRLLPLPGTAGLATALADPAIQDHLLPLAFYVVGSGFVSLLFAIFTSLLRTRVILVVSGCSQVGNLALSWVFLKLGWGVDGALWAISVVSWLTALVYFLWLAPLLSVRRPRQAISLFPALRLSVAAWLTNLAGGALLKQVVVSLLVLYAFSKAQIGFFNLAFQLGHSAGLLLVAGLSGVGMATMAAAYTGKNRSWLAASWRAVLKVQILLSMPLLVFSLLNAQAIAVLLFGQAYADVGPLLQLFLAFNILTRISGGGTHQAALYVLEKQRFVVFLQWASLALTAMLGFLLIPTTGPMGALIATGLPPVLVELAQLAYVLPSINRRYPLRFVLRYAVVLAVPIVASLFLHPVDWLRWIAALTPLNWLRSIMAGTLLDWLGLIAAGLLFSILLIVTLLLVKPLEAEDAALLGRMNSWLRAALMLLIRKSALATVEASSGTLQ
ncbi:MAG TPA: oligosaccharide flippase family protein [Ktedonobacterales bacterium]|nr:oligosaccharide flippase family protein [Ktedonobacterales bacterium]